MDDADAYPKPETGPTGTHCPKDDNKKSKKNVLPQSVDRKQKIYPKDVSPQQSSSSYTTADEDQVPWSPNDSSVVRKYDELLARHRDLEKLYQDKCKVNSALKHELDCLRDTSCIDASMGQLSSGVDTWIKDPSFHEKLREFEAILRERAEVNESLVLALKEKNDKDDLMEKENENRLQNMEQLKQQLSRMSASIQNTPTQQSVSPQAFKALQDENLHLKQELADKDLLYQDACTKQFSLEADLRELEERNRQQEIELRAAILSARRAQISEDSKQVENLLENIVLSKDVQEDDSKDPQLWEEIMSAQEQAHLLLVGKLERQHRDEIVQKENDLRLEMSAKIKELEEKHFEEISAKCEQLKKELHALSDVVKKMVFEQLAVGHTEQGEDVPSVEKVMLSLDGENEELKQKMGFQIRSLVSYEIELVVRTLEEQHMLNLKRQLANQELVQRQEIATLRTELDHERQLQITHVHQELSKKHKEEVNELIQMKESERRRLKFYLATGGCGMSRLKKQLCMEYKVAFQGLVSSWYGQWKQEMSSISARLDFLSDTPQSNRDSDVESLQLIGLEEADSLLGEQERLLSEAKDIGQRLIQRLKSSLGDIMKSLEVEHSRVVERIEEMRSELEEAGAAARLQALVDRLRLEKLELQNSHRTAMENMCARHDNEVARLRRLVQEVQAGGESEALEAQRLELEQRHQQEVEELRSYFEQKCADVGKNYSEEVYSQHSRKMSGSNCSSECELGSEIYYTGPGAGIVSVCGSSSAGDSSRQVQHPCDPCLDHNCKEKEESLIREFQEQIEAQRLSLESRYQGELETLKEEYELRVKELVRDMTQSHNEELISSRAQWEEEKACLCSEIQILKAEVQSKMTLLEEETEQRDKLQADYEISLKELETLREELSKLQDVSCHEVSREIETTTEEWVDSLEIISEPRDNASVKWGKNAVKSELEVLREKKTGLEEEIAVLQKSLEEMRFALQKSLQKETAMQEMLEDEKMKRTEEIADLQKSLEEQRARHEEEKATLMYSLQEEKTRQAEEVAALQKRLNAVQELEKKCTKLSERVAELEQKCDVSVHEKTNLENRCENLDDKCLEIEQCNEHLKKECLDWELKYIDLNKLDENLKLELNSVNVKLENTLRTKNALSLQIHDLEFKLDNQVKVESALKEELTEVKEKLKRSEEAQDNLLEELKKLQSEKENFFARCQADLKEKHEGEVARLKKYYEELQNRSAEGKEDSTEPCEQNSLREELNEALQREKDLLLLRRQWEDSLQKKDANIAHLTELLQRKETTSTHQMAVLKAKLRESHDIIDWYDQRGRPAEEELRTEGCGAPSKIYCPSENMEVSLGVLLSQIESHFAEHFRLIQRCTKESQVETAVKFVRALEQLYQQHDRELTQLDLPTKQSFSRRGSTCYSSHSGEGDGARSLNVATLDDLIVDSGASDSFSDENMQILRKLSEELEAKHLSLVEGLQTTFAQQLKEALNAQEEEFGRLESELRLEQEVQIREVRLDADRRLKFRLEEARNDIVHTLENSVQALLTEEDEEGEWPPELQKLEEKLSAKYRRELEAQKEIHLAEIQKLRQQLDARTQRKGVKNALLLEERLAVVTSERNRLRTVAGALRDLVYELVRYFASCEDRMSTTLMEELAVFGQDMSILRSARKSCDTEPKYEDDGMNSLPLEENDCTSLVPVTPNTPYMKRVRFAENLSGIVKGIDDPTFVRFVNVCQNDASMELLEEIDHCISQLRSEAEALFALTQKNISYEEDKTESIHLDGQAPQTHDGKAGEQRTSEKESARERRERRESSSEVFFEEFGDSDEISPRSAFLSPRGKVVQELLKKARVQLPDTPQVSLFLEELGRGLERIVEESRREEENLRQQVKAADKKWRETNRFMEEQVAEREQERDELQRLRDVVKEKERERSSRGHISKEYQRSGESRADIHLAMESLTHQLHDAVENLRDAEKKITLLEEERDYSLDKVRMLQENINDLEGQLLKRMQEEASLETRICMLQNLTEQQGKTHLELAQECENLRKDSIMTEEVRALQDKLQQYELFIKEGSHLQTMQEMRSQLGDIELLVECRTKLLENASAAAPGSPSLSSPSEDVSARETVEVMRSIMREENEKRQTDKLPSLPVDAVSRLEEKMQRHVRAEEALLKKIRDLDMQLNSIRSNQTEIQTERDILSERLQEQLLQTAQLEARVDELRRKGDSSQKLAINSIKGQLSEAQAEMAVLQEDLETRKRQCDELQKTLERTQSSLQKKEREVNQVAESHQYLIEQLKTQIAKNLKEKEKLKELYSNKTDSSTTLPLLVNSMLDDKNADIDMLRSQVNLLKKQVEATKLEKRDQLCSPIPYESAINTNSTFQKSGVRCEYSATPESSFSYSEGEKLRDHVQLSSIIECTNISEVEVSRQSKADERMFPELSMAQFTQPPPAVLPPSEIDLHTFHVPAPPDNDSMGSSTGPEQSHRDGGEPSQTQSDTLQSMVDELRTTVANLTNDKNSLQDELSVKESEIAELTEKVRSSQKILANLQTKLEEARRMADNTAASGDLIQENNDLKERVVAMRAELEENFKQRENELRRLLDAEQNAARAAHQELESARTEFARVVKEEEQRVKKAEEEKLHLESELVKARNEVSNGSTKLLSEKLENEKEFSKALKEELNTCRVRITELERDLERLKEERAEKVSESVSRLAELKKCQEQLEFLLGENSKLDAELTALKAQQRLDQEEQSRSEYLIQEITHLREENLEVGRELADLKKNMNKMRQDEATRANQEHKELRHLLRDNNKLKKELSSLRRAIEGVYGGDSGPPSPDGSAGGLSNEDKALILTLRNKMDCLSVKLDTPKESSAQRRSRLTRTAILTNEYRPPGSPLRESESLEDLTGLVRRELDVSAHLDDTLLQSLQPLGTREQNAQPSTSQVRENGRPFDQDIKKTQLTEVLQQLKTSNVKISTELSETRCAVRLLQNQLEIERTRYKTLQEQDSNLIEAMRIKLEQALDSEAQMKTLLETKRLQRQKPVHHLPSGGGDELMKSAPHLSERYHEAETCRASVEKQMKVLESQLARAVEELERRREAQEGVVKKARELELRRSRKRAAEEEQHRKKLDLANIRLEELQKELEGTRRQLRAVSHDLQDSRQQEADLRRELAEIRTSQLQDHRHILKELEGMKKHDSEKNYMADQVKNLLEERNQLQMKISHLEEELASRMGTGKWSETTRLVAERGCWERERTALHAALTQATEKRCSHDSDFEQRVNYLFGKYLRCESYRKALIWQKRYLLLVVNSYHESRHNLLLSSNSEIRLHCPRPISISSVERDAARRRNKELTPINKFRLAALVIKAIVRMRFLVQRWCRSRRIGSNVVMSKNFVQAPSDIASDISVGVRRIVSSCVSAPSSSVGMAGDAGPPPYPQYERPSSGSPRVPVHRNTAPWSTEASLASYVSRFNVMQQRFDALLAQTPNS